MNVRVSTILAAAACTFLFLSSCSLRPGRTGLPFTSSVARADGHAVVHRYESGPVTFIVRTSETKIDTAQNLTLTLIAKSAAGWTIRLPGVGKKLGRFSVASRQTFQPQRSAGATTIEKSRYELEPFLPGSYVIPPLTVSATNGKTTKSISSDPIPVVVNALVPAGARHPLRLQALAGPVPEPSVWPEVIASASVLIAVFAATFVMVVGRIRRRLKRKAAAIPPWVRARRDLDNLVGLDLPLNGRSKEFYNRINLLVRRYIEEMFDVGASEQTTEEFLYAVRYSPALGRHRRFLSEFLGHCDLVKFAAYLPAQDEVHRAIRSCRDFIDSTSRDYSDWTGEGSKDR